jgi:hypothetical protein
LSGEPLVEGNVEVEELFFAVEGVDHLDVELGTLQRPVRELANVVEEIAGEGAVRVDSGSVEAEIVVVFDDQFVDGLVMDGDGRHREWDGNFAAGCTFGGEEAALEIIVGGGGNRVVVDGDELDPGVG